MSIESIDYVAGIEREAARVSALARAGELATRVDHLGRWKVRDVVAHLGGVHRWATRIVESESMDGPGFAKSKLDGQALCGWFDEGAVGLVATLADRALCDPCPNFNPGSDKTVGWWARRQLHETTVHRWDVERALGRVTPIDPHVAADGVDEYLDTFVRTRGKQTLVGPLTLTSTDPTRSWTLSPGAKPGRLDVAAGDDIETPATVRGAPQELLLLVWGRAPLSASALDVHGSHEVAASLKPEA